MSEGPDMECKLCDFVAKDQISLGQHLRGSHDGAQAYYERFFPKFCETCGDKIKYVVSNSRIYFERKYCSWRCSGLGNGMLVPGEDHPNWKGGRHQQKSGYVLIKDSALPEEDQELVKDMIRQNGYVLEHRYVMAKILGRPLKKAETVHHKNGIRDDNSPENLELWSSRHPKGRRVNTQCPSCGHILVGSQNGK